MKIQKFYFLIQKTFIFAILFFSLSSKANSSAVSSCERGFSNLNEFAESVTKNAEFSNSETDRTLFQIYKTQFLGEVLREDRYYTAGLEDVMDVVKHYPELSKPALREYILTLKQREYEPPQSLKEVVQRLKKSADQFTAQLKAEANLGFWQRLLMPLKKEDLEGLKGKEKRAKKKEHNDQFRNYFNQVLTPEDREILRNTSMNSQKKTISIYRILERIRTQMIEEGKDVQALSQAMVDLVHTSGFRNPYYIDMLKSPDALTQITGLEHILNERDSVAIKLNFKNRFSELINSFDVNHPTGSTKNEKLSQFLSDIQKEVQNSSYTTAISGEQVLRVRALSLQESPFRGCLGAECSTEAYFDLALDPNFIYFTLTNEKSQSSGHITVVLGKSYSHKEKKRIKMAFVDKIQNIQPVMILPMLEAVRLSLEETGYRLGLPAEIGVPSTVQDPFGHSNMGNIIAYIESEVNPFLTHQLINFKPHKNRYGFNRGYSMAYSNPNLLEFERHWRRDFTTKAGDIHIGSKIPKDLKIKDLLQEILSLKNSDKEEDQIKFISHLRTLTKVEELDVSEDFAEDYLISKIKDKKISLKVKKKALYTWIQWGGVKEQDALEWVTNNFSKEDQMEIVGEISNWIDSNDPYKQFISSFLYEFLKEYIGNEKDDFSFQSIVFNILSKNILGKVRVLERISRHFYLDSTDKKIVNYLIEGMSLEQVKELQPSEISVLAQHLALKLNQDEFQSLEGKSLEGFYLHLKKEQKNWLTLRQFSTMSYNAKRTIAQSFALKLNQAEVQSLEGEDLKILLPHLKKEQQKWLTLRQHWTIHPHPYYHLNVLKNEIFSKIKDLFQEVLSWKDSMR